MVKFVVLVSFCLVGICFAKPASNEQLDKKQRKAGGYLRTEGTVETSFKEYLDTLSYEQRNLIATANDVAVNAVTEDRKTNIVQQQPQQQVPSTVEISGITTGANPAPANPAISDNGGFKPQRTGSMFARIIDDIFQIPITVLQNVARLITNPFSQARKDATSLTATVK